MRCVGDRPCMESDCEECAGFRFFRGCMNGILLTVALFLTIGAAVWFAASAWEYWRASHGVF